jgi:hypothetical protein
VTRKDRASTASRALDPEKDVVPFDPARVPNWPGLTNISGTCFLNASLKLLAAVPDLDPFLRDSARDDGRTASLRRSLRFTLNYIRSGGRSATSGKPDAATLLKALQQDMVALSRTARHAGEEGYGSDPADTIEALLDVLGASGAFTIQVMSKQDGGHDASASAWQDPRALTLYGSLPYDAPRGDLAKVTTIGQALGALLQGAEHDGHGSSAGGERLWATCVPPAAFIPIERAGKRKRFAMSDSIQVPLHDLDRRGHPASLNSTVTLHLVGLAMYVPGHAVAWIRGSDGWWLQNDDHATERSKLEDLNEVVDLSDSSNFACAILLVYRR